MIRGQRVCRGWRRREGIASGECRVCVLGAAGGTGEREWVRCGDGRKGGEDLVSCSPNSQLLSVEQVHKASLEGFGEGAAG